VFDIPPKLLLQTVSGGSWYVRKLPDSRNLALFDNPDMSESKVVPLAGRAVDSCQSAQPRDLLAFLSEGDRRGSKARFLFKKWKDDMLRQFG
jgi:hypothetical protein